jgi:hypothetical protein
MEGFWLRDKFLRRAVNETLALLNHRPNFSTRGGADGEGMAFWLQTQGWNFDLTKNK